MIPRAIMGMTVLFLLCQGVFGESPSLETGKLFAGCRYKYELKTNQVKGDWLGWWGTVASTNWSSENIDSGTFWATSIQGRRVYVTAAHVLGIKLAIDSLDGNKVDNEKMTIIGRETRAYMGPIGYEVGRVGQVTNLVDIAFLEPKKEQMAKEIAPMPIAATVPRNGEKVSIVGYSKTESQQIEEVTITSVYEQEGFFILNRPVEAGFSGGPVINADGQVYGVIVSTDPEKKQTTVIRIKEEDIASIEWCRIDRLP